MDLKFNNVSVTVAPSTYSCTIMDLDDGDTSNRTTDGTLNRDRIAVKRKIAVGWDLLKWSEASTILSMLVDQFVEVYYADPLTGSYQTKTFYVSDRPAALAVDLGDGELWWSDIAFNLIER